MHTVVYILNPSYTKAVQGKTPLEAYSGKKPSVLHYRIFGSECYAHVPDKLRTNLEDKSRKCIFLGYIKETKGYQRGGKEDHSIPRCGLCSATTCNEGG